MPPRAETPGPSRLPLLAVRDVVVFPHMVLPLSVGRAKSVKVRILLLSTTSTSARPSTTQPFLRHAWPGRYTRTSSSTVSRMSSSNPSCSIIVGILTSLVKMSS